MADGRSSYKMQFEWGVIPVVDQSHRLLTLLCFSFRFTLAFSKTNNWWCFDIRPIGRGCSGQCHPGGLQRRKLRTRLLLLKGPELWHPRGSTDEPRPQPAALLFPTVVRKEFDTLFNGLDWKNYLKRRQGGLNPDTYRVSQHVLKLRNDGERTEQRLRKNRKNVFRSMKLLFKPFWWTAKLKMDF